MECAFYCCEDRIMHTPDILWMDLVLYLLAPRVPAGADPVPLDQPSPRRVDPTLGQAQHRERFRPRQCDWRSSRRRTYPPTLRERHRIDRVALMRQSCRAAGECQVGATPCYDAAAMVPSHRACPGGVRHGTAH